MVSNSSIPGGEGNQIRNFTLTTRRKLIESPMSKRPLNVLFLCTGNSCRSIIAEQLLNHLGRGRFTGYSAGSHPTGRVNPNAVQALDRHGVASGGLTSKNWLVFEAAGAPISHKACPRT